MKTAQELRQELKDSLSNCTHVNDGSLSAHVNENIQWAWENWDNKVLSTYYEGDKPESYTPGFRDNWIDNEPFDVELEQMNS